MGYVALEMAVRTFKGPTSHLLAEAPPTFVEPGINGRWIFDRAVARRLLVYRQAIEQLESIASKRLFRILLGSISVRLGAASVSRLMMRLGRCAFGIARANLGWTTRFRPSVACEAAVFSIFGGTSVPMRALSISSLFRFVLAISTFFRCGSSAYTRNASPAFDTKRLSRLQFRRLEHQHRIRFVLRNRADKCDPEGNI